MDSDNREHHECERKPPEDIAAVVLRWTQDRIHTEHYPCGRRNPAKARPYACLASERISGTFRIAGRYRAMTHCSTTPFAGRFFPASVPTGAWRSSCRNIALRSMTIFLLGPSKKAACRCWKAHMNKLPP